jgi:L-rhamnose mutarotase
VSYFGLTLQLRDDAEAIERYKDFHDKPWPVVLSALRNVGVTGMRIFLDGRRLFMYLEAVDGFDPVRDFARTMEDPAYAEWEELMRTLQERFPDAAPGEWWRRMEPVFDLAKHPED